MCPKKSCEMNLLVSFLLRLICDSGSLLVPGVVLAQLEADHLPVFAKQVLQVLQVQGLLGQVCDDNSGLLGRTENNKYKMSSHWLAKNSRNRTKLCGRSFANMRKIPDWSMTMTDFAQSRTVREKKGIMLKGQRSPWNLALCYLQVQCILL